MQKKDIKASILIWSIFLSLIISISFLSISTKITKNLKESNNLNVKSKENNIIKNILKIAENDKIDKNDYELLGNKKIIIENKTLKKSLKKNEIYKIRFSNLSNINLKLNSGIVFYNTGGTNTGILDNINKSLITNINANNILTLENYAGFSSFELTSDNKFDIPEKKYKIIEKIGNKEIIKSFGVLK